MKYNEYEIAGFSSYVYNSHEKKIYDTILNKPVRINTRNGVEPHSYLINDEGEKVMVSYIENHPYIIETKSFTKNKERIPIKRYSYSKESLKNVYSDNEKLTFFKRFHPNKKDYQRLVLLNNKVSLLENVCITKTNIDLDLPIGISNERDVSIEMVKAYGFRNYIPKQDEVEFFLVNEIDLGILIK